MYCSVDNLKEFYSSEIGKISCGILQRHIEAFWLNCNGMRVMGIGYATPYLGALSDGAERVIAMMTPTQGEEHWPTDQKNLVFLSEEDRLPIESASIDRILIIHHLECCDRLQQSLREIWRVLKANGRVLIVVPNRMGFWSRADWSPFGQGRPFTLSQLSFHLREAMFVQDRHKGALFVPPMPDSPVMMRSANVIERLGGKFMPFAAGVHIVEAGKQIYARADQTGSGSAVLEKTKRLLKPKAVAVPQGFSPTSPDLVKAHQDQYRP